MATERQHPANDLLETLAKENPSANAMEVRGVLRILHELKAQGVEESGYKIRSPYGPSVAHSSSEGRWAKK